MARLGKLFADAVRDVPTPKTVDRSADTTPDAPARFGYNTGWIAVNTTTPKGVCDVQDVQARNEALLIGAQEDDEEEGPDVSEDMPMRAAADWSVDPGTGFVARLRSG